MALSLIGNERARLTDSTYANNTGKVKDQFDLHYEQTLKELVRMHSWNCTKERAKLVETVTTITDSNDVDYTYSTTYNGKAKFTDGATKYIQYNSTTSKWENNAAETVSSTADLPPKTGWSNSSFTLTFTYDFGWEREFIVPSDCLRPMYLTNTTTATTYLKPYVDWTIEVDRIRTNTTPSYLLYIKQPTEATMDPLFAKCFYYLLATKLAKPVAGDEALGTEIMQQLEAVILPEARRVNGFEGKDPIVVDSDWLESTYTSGSAIGSSWPPFGAATWTTSFSWS
jgi:hypothetical protein